jgi:hypothetical protein
MGGVVVEDGPGAFGEAELVGKAKRHVRWQGGRLGEGAHREAHDPVARREARATFAHHAAQLGAERERRVGLDLVQASAQEQLGIRDPGGLDLHEQVAVGGGRLVDLDDLDSVGPREVSHLDRLHAGVTSTYTTSMFPPVASYARRKSP